MPKRSKRRAIPVAPFRLEPLEGRQLLAADISLFGGAALGVAIASGDTTPSKTDHTDIGSVTLGGGSMDYLFQVKNTGDAALGLTGARVVISGDHASDFSIVQLPSASVAAGSTTTFRIDFNPSAVGLRTATVNVTSDDPDEASYTFKIQGTGIPDRLPGATEDQDFTITFETLRAAVFEGTAPSNLIGFLIQSVATGTTLKKGGVAVVAPTTVADPFIAGQSLVWRGPENAYRTQDAFTVKAIRTGNVVDATEVPIRVEVAGASDAPVGTIGNQSVGETPVTVGLDGLFSDPDAEGTVLRYDTTKGVFHVGLFDSRAPLTVASFLTYVRAGDYNTNIVHRSVTSSDLKILQTGSYKTPLVTDVTERPKVDNEFGISNQTGTLSLAKQANDPRGTGGYFFSFGDNALNLDNQNDGFTVFGEVLGDGMTVVNAIAAVPKFQFAGDFANLPLQNYTQGQTVQNSNLILINSVTEASPLTYSVTANSNSALVSAAIVNGELVLTALGEANGTAEITLRATDLGGVTLDRTFTVTVANREPEPEDDDAITGTVTPVIVDVLDNDTDPDGTIDPTTVAIDTQPQNGTVSVDPVTGAITYTPNAGFEGEDTLVYEVSDNQGGTGTATVTIDVRPAAIVGAGGAKSIVFTDADGTRGTILMKRGAARVSFAGDNVSFATVDGVTTVSGSGLAISSISVTGDSTKKELTIRASGGTDGRVGVNRLLATGSMKAIKAGGANLVNRLEVEGALTTLKLSDVGDAVIVIAEEPPAALPASAKLTASFRNLDGTEISSGIAIKKLTAAAFSGDSDDEASLSATRLVEAVIGGDLEIDLTLQSLGDMEVGGDLGAGVWNIAGGVGTIVAGGAVAGWDANITGAVDTLRFTADTAAADVSAASIKTFKVTGNLSHATLRLSRTVAAGGNALGKMTVTGLADDVDVISTGNVGKVTIGAAKDTNLLAGIASGVTGLPDAAADFAAAARIKSVKIVGLPTTPQDAVNTNIAAWTLGKLSAQFASALGIAANNITSLFYADSVAGRTITDREDFKDATIAGVTINVIDGQTPG